MCRLIIVHGKSGRLNYIYPEIFNSLIKASKNDPYLTKLLSREEASHRDGWGRLNIYIYKGDISLTLHKSIKPIYIENHSTTLGAYLKKDSLSNGYVIDLVHARAKSKGMPRNIFSVHPLESITKNGYKLFLIHNGSVYRERIIKDMRQNLSDKYIELYTDSYFLTKYLASIIDDDINEYIIKDAAKYTKTALNMGLVLISDEYLYITVGSYYKEDDKPKEMRNYYKIYRYADNDIVIYASSTIVDFEEYRPKNIPKWTEVENGYFEIYKINYKEEEPRAIKIREFKI